MMNETFLKKKDGTVLSAEINKGIIESRNAKRAENLSKNEKIYEQGDGVLKIAPFDNYYIFTIYSELDIEPVPVDLNNMGSFFITFKDNESEVRIEHFKNAKNINYNAGEILFRISQEEAEKILSLNTDIFYVTSMLYDENSKSDETVIYAGRFEEYAKRSVESLTEKIAELQKTLDNTISSHIDSEAMLNKTITELSDTIITLRNEYASLQEDLDKYRNMYEELCKTTKQSNEIKEQSDRKTIDKIDEQIKRHNLIEYAKLEPKNKLINKSAVDSLRQDIIGIKPTVKTFQTLKNEKQETSQDSIMSLANIIIKTGVVYIYAFMYTRYETLYTETEKKEYNDMTGILESIGSSVKSNKYNNIVYNIVYSENDYGKLMSKYNVDTNCIVVTKDNVTLGKVNVNVGDSAINITKSIEDIINKNNT